MGLIQQRRSVMRLWFVLLSVGAAITVYVTYTRVAYLWAGVSLMTFFVLTVAGLRKYRVLLVPVYASAGAIAAFLAPRVAGWLHNESVMSSASLLQRWNFWERYGALWAHDFQSILFGTGYGQVPHFGEQYHVTADNAYLAIGLHGGALSLLFVLALLAWMTKYLVDSALRSKSPLSVGVACAFSAWPIVGMFNVLPQAFFLFFILGVLLNKPNLEANEQDVGACRRQERYL